MSGDQAQIERAARLLLEFKEPESLDAARHHAFAGLTGPPVAEEAIGRAWERFRHDRYRSVN